MSTKARNTRIFRLGELPRTMADRVVKLPKEIADEVTTRGRDVWLAGLGALATVEQEGTALYDALVKQGETLVQRGEKLEERGKVRIGALKDDVEARREAVVEKVETSVVDPMVEALQKLGVPTRAEVQKLSAQVESLAERAVSVHATKEEALDRARALAGEHRPSELVVHRKDGTVQDTVVYDA